MKDSRMSANKTAGTAAIMDPTVGIKFNRTAITPHRTAYSTQTIVNKINTSAPVIKLTTPFIAIYPCTLVANFSSHS